MIALLGIGAVIIVINLTVMVLLCLIHPCKRYRRVNKVHSKVSGGIYWSFWLRYIIEDSLVA